MKKNVYITILILSIILITCTSVEERKKQLESALRGNKKDQVDQLVKDGAILTIDTLHLAIRSGNIEIVKHLLNKGLDVNGKSSEGQTTLESAFSNDRESKEKEAMFNFLLENKAKVENPDSILNLGIKDNIPSAVAVAIEAGVAINDNMLFKARSLEVIEILLNNGADINARNYNGNTLLHYSSDLSYPYPESILEFLLKKGANMNTKNNNGETPLHYVRDVESAKLLLSKSGINKNPVNNEGDTPYQKLYREAGDSNHPDDRAFLYTLKKAGCR